MSKNQQNNNNRNQSIAMVDVVLYRDGVQYIATPGQAFPYFGEKIIRHGLGEIWLYYGVKKGDAFFTSMGNASDLIDLIASGNCDATLGEDGGLYRMSGCSHPSMICSSQVKPKKVMLKVRDMEYMASRARDCKACIKRLLPYAYVPYNKQLKQACPGCQEFEMYVPKKKGIDMEKKALLRMEFPVSFCAADKFISPTEMSNPKLHKDLVEYQMYINHFFLVNNGLDDSEIYIGWPTEEPQCDTLVSRADYEHLLQGQDRTFRLKSTAPYDPYDPFGFFDVSRARLRKSITSGKWEPVSVASLY